MLVSDIVRTKPTKTALKRAGNAGQSHRLYRKCRVQIAASKVAREPKITSARTFADENRLVIMQPTNNPQMASGNTTGRMHMTSEMRNCTGPNEIG